MTATRSTWRHLAVVFTVATILSLCPTEVQGDDTCSCPSGADGGCVPYPVPVCPGDNCNKVNVAYGKQASMSSKHYADARNGSQPACAAVNGRAGHTLNQTATGRNCVHTLPTEPNSYWQVDLGQNYTVSEVIVYSRTDQIRRLVGLDILVDSKTCKRLPDSETDINGNYQLTSTIPCDSPVTGQVVKFYKYISFSTDALKIIDFCEVQIWVCKPGLYGQDCNKMCHCLNNATCDNYFGTCPNGCAAGFHGTSCAERCGSCKDGNDTCDGTTGLCPNGCELGSQPPLCKTTCTSNTYGHNCSQECGRCKDAAACDAVNGTCPACEGNFYAPFCKECMNGYYGTDCTGQCGQCKNNATCDKTSGQCPGELCEAGYQPPLCKETCTNNTYGDNCSLKCGRCQSAAACDVFNGSCLACEGNFSAPLCKECIQGYHGGQCSERCGQCKDNAACDRDTGLCAGGCMAGYQPRYCKDKCIDNMYGNNCEETCGRCENSTQCDVHNGSCHACENRFSLPLCKECQDSRHGNDCTKRCGQCQEDGCDKNSGSCSLRGCQPGFEPPFCTDSKTSEGSNSGVIAVAVIAALVAVALVAVAIFFIRRKWRPNGYSKTTTDHGLNDLTSHDPEAVVKPSSTNGRGGGGGDGEGDQPVYANAPARSAGSPPSRSSTPRATPPTPARRRPAADSATAAAAATRAEEEEEDEDDDEGPVYGNAGNVYTTLRATKPDHDAFQKYLVDRLASMELPAEFRATSKINASLSTEAGKMEMNQKKNRFKQVVPYDRARVILTDGYTADLATDYVNASYIKGHQEEEGPAYVAAQGPRENTVADFWRLVWQEKITHIVMLTNVEENGRAKCYQYWPEEEDGSVTWGPMTVTTTGVDLRGFFCIRTFRVKREKVSRVVTQYHYVSWPDHGVPTTTSLVRFWRTVSSRTREDRAPLLVHCSAGVGRTGTYIGLDIGMKTAVRDGKCNVLDLVKRMREDRTLMVQAVEQYGFLYEALLEAYTARDTMLTTDQLEDIFPDTVSANAPNTRIDAEYKTLMPMQPLSCEKARKEAGERVNMTKNRNPSLLPFDEHLVYLTEPVADRNQYINAVFMPTFRDPRGSILTQLPMPSTLVDFWRLVYGNDITTVVSLCSPDEEEEITPYCRYWPRDMAEPLATGPYTVSLTSMTKDGNSVMSYTLELQKTGESSPRSVKVLHYEGWMVEEGENCEDMMTLLDDALSSSADGKSQPLLIQCSDGVSKSGLFSALCDIINHMTYDRQCDVYMAVRHVQTVSPNAVASLAQYRYCYQIAQQRHRDTSVYANA